MSQFKKKITAFTAMLAFLSLSGAASYAVDVTTDVLGKTDNMELSGNSTRVDVNINSGNGAVGQVDWKQFNVDANQRVNFGFSGLSQTIINRVLGGQRSEILGKLTSSCATGTSCSIYGDTGKVVFINPAGILFGAGSAVDINSFTASTFDFKNAQNLKGMTDAQLSAYQSGVLNTFNPYNATGLAPITFDSAYTTAFDAWDAANGTNLSSNLGNSKIELNGTTFADIQRDTSDNLVFDASGKPVIDNAGSNKSIAIVSDNVLYKDSLLRTGSNYNYSALKGDGTTGYYSQSNVKIITGDGVTFDYANTGKIYNQTIVNNNSGIAREITIDNSGIAKGTETIKSGDVYIGNQTGDVKIANAYIKGTKLLNTEDGDIIIAASNMLDIDNTRLETVNTYANVVDANNVTRQQTTKSQIGGEVYLAAGNGVDMDNTVITTAGSEATTGAGASDAGAIRIFATGANGVDIENSTILSNGYTTVSAPEAIVIKDSIVQADNTGFSSGARNVNVDSQKSILLDNAVLDAQGNLNITVADAANAAKGTITAKADALGNSLLRAGDKLQIESADTNLNNVALAYDTVKFHDGITTGTSNVTVENDTVFMQINKGTNVISNDITLETNGNFTMDTAKMQTVSDYSLDFERTGTGALKDYKTAAGTADKDFRYTLDITAKNADNLSVTSSGANVIVKDSSDITANKNITLAANAGDVTIDDSAVAATKDNLTIKANKNAKVTNSSATAGHDVNITADNNNIEIAQATIKAGFDKAEDSNNKVDGDLNITATKGSVKAAGSTLASDENDVNVIAYNTIKFGDEIDNATTISSSKDMSFTSTNGDITGDKAAMPTITFGNDDGNSRLAFDAKGSNKFTGTGDSFKAVNVDYKAGVENIISADDDIQLVNTTFEGPKNTITGGADVVLNSVEIKTDSTASDAVKAQTKTTIAAAGTVTTQDITGNAAADAVAQPHSYIDDVDVTIDPTQNYNQTTLDLNGSKLIVNTKTVQDPAHPSNGSVNLQLKGAGNKQAGVEITAENTPGWDVDVNGDNKYSGNNPNGESYGPVVTLNATDNELAIGKIITDKLVLDPSDKLYAAPFDPTGIDHSKLELKTDDTGYIEVRDYEGFNYDPNFLQDPTQVTYHENKVDGQHEFGDGTSIDVTKQHVVSLDNSDDQFYLIYDRPNCGEAPLPPQTVNVDPSSYIDITTLPRQSVEISKTSSVQDGTASQAGNVMSAAARISVDSGELENDSTNQEADDDE